MKNSIWKFELSPVQDVVSVLMPAGARTLSAKAQFDSLCVWALCDVDEVARAWRYFHIFGTGHAIPTGLNLKFLGMTQMNGGRFVLHIFESVKDPGAPAAVWDDIFRT